MLNAFGFQPWTDKKELPWFLKPFACYFCTSFWFGTCIAIGTIIALPYHWDIDYMVYFDVLIYWVLNFCVSRVLDELFGHNSIKSK